MRIVHLSDIHLSDSNFAEFENHYRQALIRDLLAQHQAKPIDLIVITGDLVDKGGASLLKMTQFEGKYVNPYLIFEEEFIKPIAIGIGISPLKFLFIPGNHDIDESQILWVDEKKMKESLTDSNIVAYLNENNSAFNKSNERIKHFKEFEKKFHESTPNYKSSFNQSTYLYPSDNPQVGFILINDSWRCSTCRLHTDKDEKIFFGTKQLYDGVKDLNEDNINICLFHHSLEDYKERDEVLRFLSSKGIDLCLYGHYHSPKFEMNISPVSSCLTIRGRAGLNRPGETLEEFQSGYQIIDLDIQARLISQILYRKYNHKFPSFIPDGNSAPPEGEVSNKPYLAFSKKTSPKPNSLSKDQFYKR